MTTDEKIIKKKAGLLRLAEQLGDVDQMKSSAQSKGISFSHLVPLF